MKRKCQETKYLVILQSLSYLASDQSSRCCLSQGKRSLVLSAIASRSLLRFTDCWTATNVALRGSFCPPDIYNSRSLRGNISTLPKPPNRGRRMRKLTKQAHHSEMQSRRHASQPARVLSQSEPKFRMKSDYHLRTIVWKGEKKKPSHLTDFSST